MAAIISSFTTGEAAHWVELFEYLTIKQQMMTFSKLLVLSQQTHRARKVIAVSKNNNACYWWVEHRFIIHQMNSNIVFGTSNQLQCVHLLVIELEHRIFVLEWMHIDIKPKRAFTKFTTFSIKLTRTYFCQSTQYFENRNLIQMIWRMNKSSKVLEL